MGKHTWTWLSMLISCVSIFITGYSQIARGHLGFGGIAVVLGAMSAWTFGFFAGAYREALKAGKF